MVFIKGYKFSTEAEAQAAVDACNAYYGYPKKDADDVTKRWCEYISEQDFFYIPANETLNVVLGEPTDISIKTKDDF